MDLEPEKKIVISLGGPPGVGTTSVAKALSDKFGIEHFSTGEVFRSIAKRRNIDLNKLNETAEREVDEEVDNESRAAAARGNVVLESDLAAWINKDVVDLKIWLNASLDARAGRVNADEKERTAESYNSLDDARDKIMRRFVEDARRYQEYYQIDIADLSIYDLVLDTDNLTLQEVINTVEVYVEHYIKTGEKRETVVTEAKNNV